MSKKKNTRNMHCSNEKKHKNILGKSLVPHDGTFIEYYDDDGFTPDKTTAYGEIQDVDDL